MEDQEFAHPEFVTARYCALTQLWAHQNATRFQWPAVVISAAFLVISMILSSDGLDPKNLLEQNQWGKDDALFAGVPLFFSGVGTLVMLYIMERAGKNMQAIQGEIHQIEKHMRVGVRFEMLNHPRGMRGGKLISAYMAVMGILMTLSGCLLALGLRNGLIAALVIALFFIAVFLSPRIKQRNAA
jgi:hypothetical protein